MGSERDLELVLSAAFESELVKLHKTLAEEGRLKQALLELAAQAKPVAVDVDDIARRSIGADRIWQHWAAKQRAHINMQLASVVARRLKMQEDLRRTFGRREAARDLVKRADLEAKRQGRKLQQREIETLIAMQPPRGA